MINNVFKIYETNFNAFKIAYNRIHLTPKFSNIKKMSDNYKKS